MILLLTFAKKRDFSRYYAVFLPNPARPENYSSGWEDALSSLEELTESAL